MKTAFEQVMARVAAGGVMEPAPDTSDDDWPASPREDHFRTVRTDSGAAAEMLLPCSRCTEGWVHITDERGYDFAVHCRCWPWRLAVNEYQRAGLPREAADMTFKMLDVGVIGNSSALSAALFGSSGGVLMYGPTGTGKSHTASALMQRAVLCQGVRARWLRWPDAVAEVKATFSDKSKCGEALIREWGGVQLLVLDELGVGNASEWEQDTLTRILSLAADSGTRVIATSNYDLEELERRVGARAWSRLQRCAQVEVQAADYRARRYRDEGDAQ